MSELREAAKAVINDYDGDGSIEDTEDAIANLRAALAAPETAEPVAWQARYIGPDAQTNQWSLCTAADADELVKRPDTYQVRPLYAHPPRDDWRDVQPPTEGAK